MTIAEVQEQINRAWFVTVGNANPMYHSPELTRFTDAAGNRFAVVGDWFGPPFGGPTTFAWHATNSATAAVTRSERYATATLALAALATFLGAT